MKQLLADPRLKEAEELLSQARKIEESYVFEIFEGDIQLGYGNQQKALEIWDQMVEKYSGNWKVYHARTERLLKLGMITEAIEGFEDSFTFQEKPRLTDNLLT